MGTCLISILNHSLPFEGQTWAEIAAAIRPRLEAMALNTPDGILELLTNERPGWRADPRWLPVEEYLVGGAFDADDNPQKWLRFDGPGGLSLRFDRYRIESAYPPYRYAQWLDMRYADGTAAEGLRNQWRHYLRLVAQAFGATGPST